MLPSLEGARPSCASTMPFSIAFIEDLSNGWIVSIRASGTLMVASCFSGVMRAVVVDGHAVEQLRARAAGPDGPELALRGLHRASHAITGVGDQLVGQLTHVVVSTSVPTRSPDTIRSMFCSSSMLKT